MRDRTQDKTYSQRYKCRNCDYSGTTEIPQGTSNYTKQCPVCKVKAYRKAS